MASKFSAYDSQNEQPAKELLQQAYGEYHGTEQYPKDLFTWDNAHKCYVQFMHSGEGKYHGYDQKDLSKVPDSIKSKYNIWKNK